MLVKADPIGELGQSNGGEACYGKVWGHSLYWILKSAKQTQLVHVGVTIFSIICKQVSYLHARNRSVAYYSKCGALALLNTEASKTNAACSRWSCYFFPLFANRSATCMLETYQWHTVAYSTVYQQKRVVWQKHSFWILNIMRRRVHWCNSNVFLFFKMSNKQCMKYKKQLHLIFVTDVMCTASNLHLEQLIIAP